MKKKLLIIFVVLSFMLAGCTKTVGYVDESKKKTLEEVKEYTADELRNKYNIEVDIIDVEIRDVSYCNGSIDGSCYSKRVIKGADEYVLKCKSSEGVEFYVVYTDAYTNNNSKEYYDISLKENYLEIYKNFKINEDILYNINNIMNKNNIKGMTYNSYDSSSFHAFNILININEIDKIKSFTNELNNFILEKYNKEESIYYYLYVGDNDILNLIKENEIANDLHSLKEYNFVNLYHSGDSITSSEYKKYTQDKKYINYLISINYHLNKNTNTNYVNLFGIEKRNNGM